MKNFKRIREGGGTNQFSARDINMVFKILEGLEGIGCRVVKGSGGKWFIVVDGVSGDVEQPSGTTTLHESLADAALPNGTEIPGEVYWDSTTAKLMQHVLIWNSTTHEFEESETPRDIVQFSSHENAHGIWEG